MFAFWLIAGLLAVLAVAFVLVPLMRARISTPGVDRNALNVAVIKQQLAELKDDLDAGKLDSSEFDSARRDLEAELLYDVEQGEGSPAAVESSGGRWLAALIGVAVPLMAGLLYWKIGAYPVMAHLETEPTVPQSASAQSDEQQLPSVDVMAQRLAERLQEDPTDQTGWHMLGKTYTILERYNDAVVAYERANELSQGKDPEVLVDYAEALALTHNGRLAGRPKQLLDQALLIQPNHPKALWLIGYAAFQAQDIEQAIATWQRLSELFPRDSEEYTRIQKTIQEARAQAPTVPTTASNQGTEGTPPTATASATTTKSIRTQIVLDDSLHHKASPDDTVFVFARAVEGPRMPLAIVRKHVRDLPMTVELNDSMAMSPGMNLSSFPAVVLEARISKTGTARAQSGDLQGLAEPVTPGTEELVQVIIDRVIP